MHVRQVISLGLLAALALGGTAHAGSGRGRMLYDFGDDDVIVWSLPEPGADRVGFGRLGQQFEADRSEQHGLYQCDENFASTLWHHGRNTTTGDVGWVAACDVTDPD
ncbi:hypothetical protein AB0C27_04955 [Nonomuraea sp. NPDC048882]|uniref:hypothetical protein n=1 Tax=unclassified Nonomuraea TaxID=2593643 RepID=UPI0033F147A0